MMKRHAALKKSAARHAATGDGAILLRGFSLPEAALAASGSTIARKGKGRLCAPEGLRRFRLGIAAGEADILEQGVVEARQLAALAGALMPQRGTRHQLAGRRQPERPDWEPIEQPYPEHGLLPDVERSSGGRIHHA
jgi:hypothetical protein